MRILILAAIWALACTTKVSEWVLLNAPANQYTLIYFYNGPDKWDSQKSERFNKQGDQTCHIEFRSVEKKDIGQPFYSLYYGNRLFRRYNDPKDLNWTDSLTHFVKRSHPK